MDSRPIAGLPAPLPPRDDEATAESAAPPPPPLTGRLTQPRTILSFAIGFGLLFLAYQRLNVDAAATWQTLRGADPSAYLLAIAVYYLAFLIRSARWRSLLRNVGYRRGGGSSIPNLTGLARILLLGWFVNCLVPAKLGDAYRAYLLKRHANVSFSKTVGTVLAERVLDLVVLFGLLGIAAWWAFGSALPTVVVSLVEVALGLAVVLLVGLVAMRLLGGRIRGWLPLRLQAKYGLFEEGTLQSFRGLPLLTLETGLIWLCEALRLYLVMVALGARPDHFAVPLFVSLAGALLTTVPFTPAGLGFVESGLVSLLLLFGGLGLINGMTTQMAITVAVLDRTISYWSIIAVGAVLHVLRGTR